MSVLRLLLVVSSAVGVASCTDPAASLPSGPQLGIVGEGLHRVRGSGHVEGAAGLREFTFHAYESPQGTVNGSYKVVLPNGLFFEAAVTCLAVEGNTGWVGGTIRETNADVVVVGSRSMFYAVDGGEGAGLPDVVSLAAFNMPEGTDLEFCLERPLVLPPLNVTDGNVQVD